MIIDPETGWFEIIEYNNKQLISIDNLVETTWMSTYHRPIEITYGQGS